MASIIPSCQPFWCCTLRTISRTVLPTTGLTVPPVWWYVTWGPETAPWQVAPSHGTPWSDPRIWHLTGILPGHGPALLQWARYCSETGYCGQGTEHTICQPPPHTHTKKREKKSSADIKHSHRKSLYLEILYVCGASFMYSPMGGPPPGIVRLLHSLFIYASGGHSLKDTKSSMYNCPSCPLVQAAFPATPFSSHTYSGCPWEAQAIFPLFILMFVCLSPCCWGPIIGRSPFGFNFSCSSLSYLSLHGCETENLS